MQLLLPVVLYACAVAGLFIPEGTIPFTEDFTRGEILTRDTTCENTATSRSCWGEFDIDTDYYDIIPDTGVTREVSSGVLSLFALHFKRLSSNLGASSSSASQTALYQCSTLL